MNTHLKLALLLAALFLSLFVGAAIFQRIEAGNYDSEGPYYGHDLWYFEAYHFCVSVVTTVGYGHVYPVTAGGKVFTFFYALFNIPLLIIILADIGRKLANLIGVAETKVLGRVTNRHLRFLVLCLMTTVSGLVIFLVIPAAIFIKLDGWTYMEGFWYAFATITTIGFGDLVAGMQMVNAGSTEYNVYAVALSMYTVLGLTWPATLWVLVADYLYGSKGTEQEGGQKGETVAM